MSVYSNMQLTGASHTIRVHNHHNNDWIEIRDGNTVITMNPIHVRALTAALDAYYDAKEKDATK